MKLKDIDQGEFPKEADYPVLAYPDEYIKGHNVASGPIIAIAMYTLSNLGASRSMDMWRRRKDEDQPCEWYPLWASLYDIFEECTP